MSFLHQTSPILIPTVDGKTIEEHFGLLAGGSDQISVARMIAPPGWSEPPQRPEFDEYTLIIRGKKRITLDDSVVELSEGESFFVSSGTRVQYSNPYTDDVEYWAVCLPAFSPDKVHREPD